MITYTVYSIYAWCIVHGLQFILYFVYSIFHVYFTYACSTAEHGGKGRSQATNLVVHFQELQRGRQKSAEGLRNWDRTEDELREMQSAQRLPLTILLDGLGPQEVGCLMRTCEAAGGPSWYADASRLVRRVSQTSKSLQCECIISIIIVLLCAMASFVGFKLPDVSSRSGIYSRLSIRLCVELWNASILPFDFNESSVETLRVLNSSKFQAVLV